LGEGSGDGPGEVPGELRYLALPHPPILRFAQGSAPLLGVLGVDLFHETPATARLLGDKEPLRPLNVDAVGEGIESIVEEGSGFVVVGNLGTGLNGPGGIVGLLGPF